VAQVYRRLLAPPCDTASSDAIEEKPAEPPTHRRGGV